MNVYAIWLEWPEECFRLSPGNLKTFRSLAPRESRIIRAKNERDFVSALSSATHAITWSFKREWYAKAPRLKAVATPAAGRELVAEPPEGSRVKVHFGAYHGETMAESVAAYVLAWARGFFLPEMKRFWPRKAVSGKCYTLAGTKAVIAGYGHVGRKIGEKLSGLGVEVKGFGRAGRKELVAAMRSADWFVMALPATPETDNFLSAEMLSRLPPRAVVVNVGRGNAIDENALLASLRAKRIAGACLDVCKGEPTAVKGRPSAKEAAVIAAARAGRLPTNLFLTPHSSAFSPEYLDMAFREMKNDGFV